MIRLEEAALRTHHDTVVLAGGVAANSHLRTAAEKLCEKHRWKLCMPERSLCGDNAAMVGAQAYYDYLAGSTADTALNAHATV